MLEKNNNIYFLKEQEISIKNVFNYFFEINSNIIYVVNESNEFIGVITSGEFLKNLRKGKKEVFINRHCSIITLESKEDIFAEAIKLFNQYKITTAIPVLDKNKKICYEIKEKNDDTNKKILKNFYEKLKKYEKSYYLKEEIICLHKILENQDIIVIGTENQFESICGYLFPNKNKIIFLNNLDDAYDFFYENTNLVIDVSVTEHFGRKDIYAICNNGYGWNTFFDIIIEAIESESCSRYYRIIDNDVVTLKEIIEKYLDRKIILSSQGIFISELKEYLKKNHFDVIEQKGICRQFISNCNFKANGIINKNVYHLDTMILMTDVILQFFYLNTELHNKVHLLNFVFDSELKVNNTKGERIKQVFDFQKYITDVKKNNIKNSLYSKEHTQVEYLTELEENRNFRIVRRFENDLITLKDYSSNLINIENGIRKTCYQPDKYEGTIYFFGLCTIYGLFVEDCYTIPSIIQKYINESGIKYRVVNLGNMAPINYYKLKDIIMINKKDIIVMFFPVITKRIKNSIPIIEIGEYINNLKASRYKNNEIFLDSVEHCGDNGNMIYSEIIYEKLKSCLVKVDNPVCKENNLYNIFKKNETDLKILYNWNIYVAELKKMKKKVSENVQKIGCIVMNCNPFTLGHRYLIEYALKIVDYLYIFVVEEDRSFFSFQDRFKMVQRGTSDLKNISVIRSGKLIISAELFPAYFQKHMISNRENIFVTEDLRIFAQYIVPILNIQYRFIGEEPDDYVTRQYNEKMKKILSKFNIQVVEIPRKFVDKKIISASMVRKYYQNKEFQKLEKLVPKTTLDYILKNLNN